MKSLDYIYLLFLFVISLDPVGAYTHGIKELLFAILSIYGMARCVMQKRNLITLNRIIVISVLLLPIWGIFVAILKGNYMDPQYAQAHFKAMLFVFLIFYLIGTDIKIILKCIWINGIVLAVVTLALYIYSFVNFDFVYNLCVNDNSAFMMAVNREFLGIPIMGLYFNAGPLIMFAFAYNLYYYKGFLKLLYSILLYIALVVAGSRTPMLLQTLILLLYFYDSKIIGKKIMKTISFVAILALLYLTYKLATETGQNEIKYDNMGSYWKNIGEGINMITGAGVGSQFYASGNGEPLSYTELSYMDILRMYGLIVGTYFIFLYLSPFLKLKPFWKNSLPLRRLLYCYVFFLILAGTNPILMGSTGMAGLTLFMAIMQYVCKKRSIDFSFK